MEDEALKKEILYFIRFLKRSTPEEIKFITLSCYKILLLSSFTFGISNEITKDCLNILREYVDICNIENDILDFILDNINELDLDNTANYLEDLDQLNEMTYLYYDGVIADYEYAIEAKNSNKGKRRNRTFNTLLDNNHYEERLYSLKK